MVKLVKFKVGSIRSKCMVYKSGKQSTIVVLQLAINFAARISLTNVCESQVFKFEVSDMRRLYPCQEINQQLSCYNQSLISQHPVNIMSPAKIGKLQVCYVRSNIGI